ncbi:hypothetical protein BIV57_02910 [Mangrovactinospora gilvigrisea]|uniref:Uncharacterized protein n=1 Tax=Mangrovactinospora gilvigrisea TaxID=1428644 RepID=A0A1J7BK15_9ACTN|nr:hypothetical protein [Mangrovactinospora gilvigrisea]OIV38933.1 hypothetical protein BIV57_02910 [Mangrovactinospora gilvigrisea]
MNGAGVRRTPRWLLAVPVLVFCLLLALAWVSRPGTGPEAPGGGASGDTHTVTVVRVVDDLTH